MSVNSIFHNPNETRMQSTPCKSSYARQDILELLKIFNDQFLQEESLQPKEGYLVQFVTNNSGLAASLIPHGAQRLTKLLSGIPQTKKDSCPFCPEELSKSKKNLNTAMRASTAAVRSLSGQLLIVPKEHYSHWFEAPVELQADLLEEAIEIRNKYPESQNRPIELHCGSAAGQTVFHIHVRTGVYPQ